MTRYVISDLHLDHGNIIKYCDRPFDDVADMNHTLVENWNAVVDPEDTVFYLGDLAMWGPDAAEEWAAKLNGNLVFVRGNHDDLNEADLPVPVCDACVVTHGKYRFGCVHWPEETADPGGDWLLYGHHHNNDVGEYPFIDPERNRVNLSVELIGYEPLSLDHLCELLDHGERYETLAAAEASV